MVWKPIFIKLINPISNVTFEADKWYELIVLYCSVSTFHVTLQINSVNIKPVTECIILSLLLLLILRVPLNYKLYKCVQS